jgi:hypothetical protein
MPLNDWHYGSDTAAGEYKYMMGGLVIPLMATLGINNKVSFLEKHGTGNSYHSRIKEHSTDKLPQDLQTRLAPTSMITVYWTTRPHGVNSMSRLMSSVPLA